MVRTIKNFPVTIGEVFKSTTIYGCGVPTLKGKTFRQQPNHIQAEYIEVTDSVKGRVGNLTVAAYFMSVNIIPFVVSVLRGVNFITV